MKVVLDSNVLVSATLTPNGLSGRILSAWRDQRFTLCTSISIAQEASRVLFNMSASPRYQLGPESATAFLEELTFGATFPHLEVEPITVCRDPKDNMVLECAVGCEADLVVTNDEDLLALKAHAGVGIVSLRDFLRTLGD